MRAAAEVQARTLWFVMPLLTSPTVAWAVYVSVSTRISDENGDYGGVIDAPTGVMWHSTCVPSIPTQLNVECGKVLLPIDLRWSAPMSKAAESLTCCS